MLSKQEKDGCRDLLSRLTKDEILSLAQTVTNRQIAFTKMQEVVHAILTYTERPIELLRRRKVKRKYIFQYLAGQQVVVPVNADKAALVRKTLEHWGCRPEEIQAGLLALQDDDEVDTPGHEDPPAAASPAVVAGPAALRLAAGTANNGTRTQGQVVANQAQVNGAMAATNQEAAGQTDSDHQMAVAFALWFYSMLNAYHPDDAQGPIEEFGPQHFYNDCKMKLLCATPAIRQEEFEGSLIVCQRFLAFVREERLKFNPNLDAGGVQVRADPYGSRRILVCGTVHMNGDLAGIFEHQFWLARDPDMANNWRIKFSYLKIKSDRLARMPTLQDTQTALAIEMPP